jgi:hypothetical protein
MSTALCALCETSAPSAVQLPFLGSVFLQASLTNASAALYLFRP